MCFSSHSLLLSPSLFRLARVCVVCATDDSISHFPCPYDRQSLLEANGVAQLQNVAACDSIMPKMRVLLFVADNAADSVFLLLVELENAAEWKFAPNLKTDELRSAFLSLSFE